MRNGWDTEFGKPLKLAFDRVDKLIDKYQKARINFFTDGYADYPKEAINEIENTLTNNKNNYQC